MLEKVRHEENQGISTILGFSYALYKGMRIHANKCIFSKGVSVLFFQDDRLITSVSGDFDKIEENENNHYLIKGKEEVSISIASQNQYESYNFNVGDKVLRTDSSTTRELGFIYSKGSDLLTKEKEKIESDLLWEISELYENKFALIQKGEQCEIVSVINIVTIEKLKEFFM